jgi:phage FluMu protein Com
MSDHIRITCQHCNHVIKAPRKAVGRRGKCPHCHNSVYIPTPESELDEIPLELDDKETRATKERLEKEAMEIAAAIGRETKEAPQPRVTPQREGPAPHKTALDATEINDLIIRYLLAMQVSELERAEALVTELKGAARQAKSKIQQMMVDSMRPEAVRSMADGLYQGFLRKLLEQL